jgi:hypothetical protein
MLDKLKIKSYIISTTLIKFSFAQLIRSKLKKNIIDKDRFSQNDAAVIRKILLRQSILLTVSIISIRLWY